MKPKKRVEKEKREEGVERNGRIGSDLKNPLS